MACKAPVHWMKYTTWVEWALPLGLGQVGGWVEKPFLVTQLLRGATCKNENISIFMKSSWEDPLRNTETERM